MSTLSEIQQLIAPELRQLNDLIAQILSSPNKLMNSIVSEYLKTKGKQIRPILVILSARLLGSVNDSVISAAAAVELLHNASLIHDDVVDETKTRRGNPTITGVWDNHIAVLVGDFFVSSSLMRALDTNDPRVLNSVAQLGRHLSLGELDQLYSARFHTLDESVYFNTIQHKTASLFMSCVELGGFTVGAAEEQIADVREFARLLGLCFQIKDDIFDYYEDERIGKPTGNDLREGKITLPLLHVLSDNSLPQHKAMLELSRKENLDSDEITTLIEYAKSNGGIDYAYSTMARLRDQAVEILAKFGDRPETHLLRNLIDYTISRPN